MKIKASELPLQSGGEIYHLGLFPEELADTILLVGDPGRVELVSSKFDSIFVKKQNRELCTHTGIYKNKKMSVISTGMGTDNIDIVVNELDALANIDFEKKEVKKQFTSLTLIRIGTCGILQPDIDVNSFIASEYGLGTDGVIGFYDADQYLEKVITRAFIEQTGWQSPLPYPYCVKVNSELIDKIAFDMKKGITVTAPGFFGPQGRALRAPLHFPDLNSKIEKFEYDTHKITNLEMECSALYGLSKVLNHKALTCCVGIANRITGDFVADYHDSMNMLVETILNRIVE